MNPSDRRGIGYLLGAIILGATAIEIHAAAVSTKNRRTAEISFSPQQRTSASEATQRETAIVQRQAQPRLISPLTRRGPSEEHIEAFWNSLQYMPERQVEQTIPEYADPNSSGNRLFKVNNPDVYIAENFKLREFVTSNNSVLPYARLNRELVSNLQRLRERLGKPIIVTSGYRPPWRQQQVNPAAPLSRHQSGDAADIYVPHIAPKTLAQVVTEVFGENIGLGTYEGKNIVHIDVRGRKDRW